MIDETFATFRSCGANRRECQVFWLSPWADATNLTEVAHPSHDSNAYALSIDSDWINRFWLDLANRGMGVRIQIHTHAFEAFHSETDDSFPLLSDVGFLSLVIPNFAKGAVGFDDAYLTEIQPDGRWQQVDIRARIRIDG